MYEFKNVRGHVEVYLNGAFCFSADTLAEAHAELKEMRACRATARPACAVRAFARAVSPFHFQRSSPRG